MYMLRDGLRHTSKLPDAFLVVGIAPYEFFDFGADEAHPYVALNGGARAEGDLCRLLQLAREGLAVGATGRRPERRSVVVGAHAEHERAVLVGLHAGEAVAVQARQRVV